MMRKYGFAVLVILFALNACHQKQQTTATGKQPVNAVLKAEMTLSAFGVEADSFPSANVFIDFANDSGWCKKTYYNPAIKDTSYALTPEMVRNIRTLLQRTDLSLLKADYRVAATDLPLSTTIIYTTKDTFRISDYGLKGAPPLPDLYKMAYGF